MFGINWYWGWVDSWLSSQALSQLAFLAQQKRPEFHMGETKKSLIVETIKSIQTSKLSHRVWICFFSVSISCFFSSSRAIFFLTTTNNGVRVVAGVFIASADRSRQGDRPSTRSAISKSYWNNPQDKTGGDLLIPQPWVTTLGTHRTGTRKNTQEGQANETFWFKQKFNPLKSYIYNKTNWTYEH